MQVRCSKLQLGDKVKLFNGAYGWATVTQLLPNRVVVTRPFLSTPGIPMGKHPKVVPYTGLETVELWKGNGEFTYEIEE